MRGDLKELYQREVLDAPDGEEREKMMSVMNIMCGNIEIDCAYDKLGKFYWLMSDLISKITEKFEFREKFFSCILSVKHLTQKPSQKQNFDFMLTQFSNKIQNFKSGILT